MKGASFIFCLLILYVIHVEPTEHFTPLVVFATLVLSRRKTVRNRFEDPDVIQTKREMMMRLAQPPKRAPLPEINHRSSMPQEATYIDKVRPSTQQTNCLPFVVE